MRDTYISLRAPSSIGAIPRNQASFWNCNRMKFNMQQKISQRSSMEKKKFGFDFQADGEF